MNTAPSGPVPLTDFARRIRGFPPEREPRGALALERACAAAGFAPRIRYRSNDYDVVRSFVRAGLGVAAVPRLAYLGRVGLRDIDVTGTAHPPTRRGPDHGRPPPPCRDRHGHRTSSLLGAGR